MTAVGGFPGRGGHDHLGAGGVLPAWGCALIVGAVLLATAAGLAMLSRKQFQRATPPGPSQATAGVKADVEEIKQRAHR